MFRSCLMLGCVRDLSTLEIPLLHGVSVELFNEASQLNSGRYI